MTMEGDRETRHKRGSQARMQRLRERQRHGLKQLRVFVSDAAVEAYMRETNPNLAFVDEAKLWEEAEKLAAERLAEIFVCDA
jgi:hypothetical protein